MAEDPVQPPVCSAFLDGSSAAQLVGAAEDRGSRSTPSVRGGLGLSGYGEIREPAWASGFAAVASAQSRHADSSSESRRRGRPDPVSTSTRSSPAPSTPNTAYRRGTSEPDA